MYVFILCSNACVSVAFGVLNDYESDREEDYVNVDPADNKNKLEEEAGAVGDKESADYEEPESDEDHDYEEVAAVSNVIQANTVCFSLDENRKEEEQEENGDDDADYENVTPTGDIYGEHEDIYQNL